VWLHSNMVVNVDAIPDLVFFLMVETRGFTNVMIAFSVSGGLPALDAHLLSN
jgi:hypothetical protein